MPKPVRRGFLLITGACLSVTLLVAFAVPNLLRRRIVIGSERTAPHDLCNIRKAVRAYMAEHGATPPTLSSLQGRVDPALSCDGPTCEYRYFRFQYTVSPSDPGKAQYSISAEPPRSIILPSGPSFYLDESGVLRYTEEDRAATKSDPPMPATMGSCNE